MQIVVGLFFAFVIGSVILSWLGGGDYDRGWHVLGQLIETGLLIWAGYYAYSKREAIARFCYSVARWYYFTFHPHPAEPLVRAAIESPNLGNGKALAAALGELPPGNSIFRGVRLVQAERLFNQMQVASARRLRAIEAHAKAEYERAAVLSIQEAMALAAVALERAKALYRASQRT
jgi:hypothetical protein